MEGLFLRNCSSTNEYFLFKKNYPEYLEKYQVNIVFELEIIKKEFIYFVNNIRLDTTLIGKYSSELLCNNDIANCIKITCQYSNYYILAFTNGYNYAKYVCINELF